MTRHWVSTAALLAGYCLPTMAMGSCIRVETAGFIHAGATHLPSNARGALFLPPQQIGSAAIQKPPPLPSDFTITSDADPGFLPVEIVALDFSGTLADTSGAIRSAGLARVGPVGGFKAGVRYTIAYTGERESGWVYPTRVEHTIDAGALRMDGAAYRLVLDGPPERQMLHNPVDSQPSMVKPATVQNFRYVVPVSHKPYQEALLYFSESRSGPDGFRATQHRFSVCQKDSFGEATLGQGRAMVAAACGPGAGRASIRAWVGMLEVEDRLRPTESVQIDFSKAKGGSCTAHGMLKAAMAGGDAQRIEHAVCAASALQWIRPQADDMPVMEDLFTLAWSGSERAGTCTRDLLGGLLMALPAQRAAYLERYTELLEADLASPDSARADQSRHNLSLLKRALADDAVQQ